MISTNNIEVKVFIEGVELPVQSVSMSHNRNTMSYASVSLPAVSSVPAIPMRSLLCIFVKDTTSYAGEDFIMQFVGETVEPTVMWSSSGYTVSLTAYSLDNHWWALPMYMNVGQKEGTVFETYSSNARGGLTHTAALSQEAALLGTHVKFTVNATGEVQYQDSKTNESLKQFIDSPGSDIPNFFIIMYQANEFWKKTGKRTLMDQPSSYYYVGGDTLFDTNTKEFMKSHLANYLNASGPRNARFIEWWELYRAAYFASWCINHQSIKPHVFITTGFEHMFPPACNIIFPHQFSTMSSIGQSLANPTRTIGVITGVSAADNAQADGNTVITGGVVWTAQPQELLALMKQSEWAEGNNSQVQEVLPGTEEEFKGIVGNIISPNSPLLATLRGENGAKFDLNTLLKYFTYIVSNKHAETRNAAGASVIPCTYLPNIQVGVPLISFRSSGSDVEEKQFNVLYGVVESVQHMITSTSASTTVTLRDSKLISESNAVKTPAPVFISNKGISFFDEQYNAALGCGSINAPVEGLYQSLGQGVGAIAGVVKQAVYGGSLINAALLGQSSFFNALSNAGDGWVDVHKSCIEAVKELGTQYEALTKAKDKVSFAANTVKRSYSTIDDVLGSYTFESRRSQWVNDYKAQLIKEHKIVATEDGWNVLNGTMDKA